MIDKEEQVRCELRAIAELIKPESIRPLRVPPQRRRSRTIRWLAPVAAAVAVAGVIAGVTVADQGAAGRLTSPTTEAGMPKYYVTVNWSVREHKRVLLAIVRAAATGTTTGSVQLPSSGGSQLVGLLQAAASDRLFVIGAADGLYALSLASDGRPDGLTRYPASVQRAVNNINAASGLLSPDGTEIAFVGTGLAPTVAVVSLITGRLVQWTDARPANTVSGVPTIVGPLAWIDGQSLVVDAPGDGQWTYWALNVSGDGGSLLANAKPIALAEPQAQPHWTMATLPTLMPTGEAWAFGEYPAKPSNHPQGARIVETSTRTGRLVHVAFFPGESQCAPFAIAPAGFYFLVSCDAGAVTNRFGRVDGGRFTALPTSGSSGANAIAAAW